MQGKKLTKTTSRFVHPVTKEPLVADAEGVLHLSARGETVAIHPVDGCYDFAGLHGVTEDRTYYDAHYHHGAEHSDGSISLPSLSKLWDQNSAFARLYDLVGNVRGKNVLLLGNGMSSKELRFVAEGASVVYTDISFEAVLSMKEAYESSTLARQSSGAVEFHAADALHLPFEQESFDIIYGCAFVHHLQDLDTFLGEVYWCLRQGGTCLFLDDAYSWWWQAAKATVLRPLQAFSHWRSGVSPEDRLATQKGGYRREELQDIQAQCGFSSLIYQRTMVFEHLIRRGSTKLLNEKVACKLAPVGRFLDQRLLGRQRTSRHGFCLVWGYGK